MPSSSLFLRSSTTLISVLSLISTPVLAQSTGSNTGTTSSLVYEVVKSTEGQQFFDDFTFFDQYDPTHGYVTYVNKDRAIADGLAKVTDEGYFKMSVDTQFIGQEYTKGDYWEKNNVGRPSVRIEGKDKFTKGLWIADIPHMPNSVCGAWPAYWTLNEGKSWPNGGEIDIIEGVSNRKRNLAALHTGGDSYIAGDQRTFTGELIGTDCQYINGKNAAGCAEIDRDENSYGTGFNNVKGRVVAMEWTDEHINVWSWPRGSVPENVKADNPDPSSWDLPAQSFQGPNVNIPGNFENHKVIVDTTFCGDFAEAVWASEGCAASTGVDTCAQFVALNPSAFTQAFWEFKSIKIYQKKAPSLTTTSSIQSSTSTSVRTSSTTSASTSARTSSTTPASTSTSTTLTTSTKSSSSSSVSQSTSTFTQSGSSSSSVTESTSTFTKSGSSSSSVTESTSTSTKSGPSSSSVSQSTSTSTKSGSPSSVTESTSTSTKSGSSSSATESTSTTSVHYGSGTTSTFSRTASFVGTSSTRSATATSTDSTTSKLTSSSTSSQWGDWTSAKGNGRVTGFPNGAGVVKSAVRDDWKSTADPIFITTTITKTYVVPCPTGLETKTATITTSFVGGQKVTYVPEIPVSTYTTSCPAEWGFGGPITMTVPITKTVVVSVPGSKQTGDASQNNGNGSNGSNNGSHASNGSNVYSNGQNHGSNSGNGNNINNVVADPKVTSAFSVSTPATAAAPTTWDAWSAPTVSSTLVQGATQASGTGAAQLNAWTGAGNGNGNSNATNPIKQYTGAASRSVVSFLGFTVAAVVGILFL